MGGVVGGWGGRGVGKRMSALFNSMNLTLTESQFILGLRRPGTQSVCLRLEKWLNRFLVPDQLGTVWGLLGGPEAPL